MWQRNIVFFVGTKLEQFERKREQQQKKKELYGDDKKTSEEKAI